MQLVQNAHPLPCSKGRKKNNRADSCLPLSLPATKLGRCCRNLGSGKQMSSLSLPTDAMNASFFTRHPSWNMGSQCVCVVASVFARYSRNRAAKPTSNSSICVNIITIIVGLLRRHYFSKTLKEIAPLELADRSVAFLAHVVVALKGLSLRSRPSKDTLVPIPIPSSLLFANDRQTARRTTTPAAKSNF